ncbi:4'-phosphopantetheinyl transferase family protein [Glaesserella parasuis]|uniref:4'-phosphopantetheinyl transferase family protein n=1 Tax=Glaesserella parasuis TaxID=738 RepID=UPI000165AFE6|nr:putative 4'-phosphopantetheinyl transferase [Glaesserella parasuis str. Nagasaki]KDD81292.1 4'-phosphopantetheinyl transferase [Glaesserella parasuis ST4-2]CDH99878.1 phosphopantetheinyl transferase [Glaesserella parasuis 29755]
MTAMNTIEIVFAPNDEFIPSDFLNYLGNINKSLDKPSAYQIKKWKSRRMAYFLLHQLFEKYHLDKSLLINIVKTESGRPYIEHSEIDFNISHSGDWVAIIFSYQSPKKVVGIDIEHPQKIRRFNDLLHYYASEQEIAEINNHHLFSELSSLESRFYLSWCLREAVLKSQGSGIIKLSEVTHSLSKQQITTAYSPTGKLCFYHQLPFYLAYFFEHTQAMLSLPKLSQWKNGDYISFDHLHPIIYQVN